jgi:Rieske Fe-S protein
LQEPEDNSLNQISRRRFIRIATISTVTVGGAAWLAVLQSCSNNSNPVTSPPKTGFVATLTLANEVALQTVGGFIRRAFGSSANGGNEVIVMRFAASGTNAFAAASVICTHQGCAVNSPSGATITCPCHGSVFGAQSSNFAGVISGPATRPLPTFATNFDGTTITITF